MIQGRISPKDFIGLEKYHHLRVVTFYRQLFKDGMAVIFDRFITSKLSANIKHSIASEFEQFLSCYLLVINFLH